MDLIIHHESCLDGICSAWVAKLRYPKAELMEAQYDKTPVPIEAARGKDVMIVDFSFKKHELEALHDVAKSLIVLDHHKSAQANCEGLTYCIFDMARSGAGITWDFLFPGKARPRLVNYVEDSDLWRWALRDSRAVRYALGSYDWTLETMNYLHDFVFDDLVAFPQLIAEGNAIERYQKMLIEGIVKNARLFTIHGYEVLGVEAPSPLRNDVAHELGKGRPFGVVFRPQNDGSVLYDLRSDLKNGGIDVSEICAHFGGGGHASAGGFRVKPDSTIKFPWKPYDPSQKAQ